jgi:glycosyltransferase involved in cell wall biosynthesis
VVAVSLKKVSHIRKVLESVLATKYPRDRMEVLVVDGLSGDGTREVVTGLAATEHIVRLVDNPKRVTPAALNIGVSEAKGDIIVRMDAHTTYSSDYVERCVDALVRTGADNVGGPCVVVPSEPTLFGRAFATALSHPFGVGNARYKLGISKPTEVDVVPFGCMWRRRMLELGPFDERYARSEDLEFSARIRADGGKLVLLPAIRSYYHARSRFGAFLRHSLSNGYWVLYPLSFSRLPNRWRHYAPIVFLWTLGLPALLSVWWRPAILITALAAGAHIAVNVAASIEAAARRKDFALAIALPPAFAILHLAYGLGSTWGLLRAIERRVARLLRRS